LEVVRTLCLECKADVEGRNYAEQTALHIAATTGDAEIVSIQIIEGKADIHARDKCAQTPLNHATQRHQERVMSALVLEFGADINARDNCGRTALHIAAMSSELHDLVYTLVETCCANIEIVDNNGKTALQY
ncbi:ankyrin repeat protein, partial [Geopyxis carbonaria]